MFYANTHNPTTLLAGDRIDFFADETTKTFSFCVNHPSGPDLQMSQGQGFPRFKYTTKKQFHEIAQDIAIMLASMIACGVKNVQIKKRALLLR